MSNIEQTLSIIKPDAIERNLDNEIKKEFINKGLVGDPDNWIETFLNEPPHIYAGKNYTYNPEDNTFLAPPSEDTE